MERLIRDIPLKYISKNPNQPRKYFDPDALESLARSILRYGVINPVTVVREGNDRYTLVSGERRFRAAKLAGLNSIPAIVVEKNEKTAALSLLENLQREELSFFEIAEGYRSLMRLESISRSTAARRIGKDDVNKKLRLLSLGAKSKQLIRDYALSEEYAQAVLSLENEDERIEALRRIHADGMSVDEARELVKSFSGKKDAPTARGFIKHIKSTLNRMKKSGVDAHMSERALPDGRELVITIHE